MNALNLAQAWDANIPLGSIKGFWLIFWEVLRKREKMVPLHPLRHPSSQQHCSSSPAEIWEKISPKKVTAHTNPKHVKYSRGCVANITNLGPNSKWFIFNVDTEYMEYQRFDLNNWLMNARTIGYMTQMYWKTTQTKSRIGSTDRRWFNTRKIFDIQHYDFVI